MGHSYVEYRGQHRLLPDIEIVTVVHLLLDASRQESPTLTPGVAQLLAAWTTLIDTYGPGTIDVDLDGHLRTDADRDNLLRLIELARQRLQEAGPLVPGESMNRIVDAPGVLDFADRPVGDVLAAFDRFAAVLTGVSAAS
ncbi:MAG TPA: hypothetical protein VK698_20315 [Kofleriaceae bacterium]|nr:hypothetical protein [Kofleriaceae bacterium]